MNSECGAIDIINIYSYSYINKIIGRKHKLFLYIWTDNTFGQINPQCGIVYLLRTPSAHSSIVYVT